LAFRAIAERKGSQEEEGRRLASRDAGLLSFGVGIADNHGFEAASGCTECVPEEA
jgi:hypothetical protein